MLNVTQNLLVILLIAFLCGCQTYKTHEWTVLTDIPPRGQKINEAFVSPIKPYKIEEAISMLREADFVRLSVDEAKAISRESIDLGGPNVPYLVRGVAWNDPFCVSVTMDYAEDALVVVQYSWSGEIMLPGRVHESEARPLVVSLYSEPGKVIPTAVTGGDGLFSLCDLTEK